jgi:hypothetical protein
MWRLFFLLISFNLYAGSACPLKNGDLVFIKSQSEQSRLLKLTTGSEWTHVGMAFKRESGWDIIEAIQPVKWTTLYSFVRRSKELSFEVRRANFEIDADKIKAYAEDKLGRNYDSIFAWDQDRWYCTELVWKAYKKASGEELGSLEKIGDLKNIDSAPIRKEAERRFANYGLPYDHEGWKKSPVITPIQMMNAQNLLEVTDQKSIDAFTDCLKP